MRDNINKYYPLDDLGPIGDQKRPPKQIKDDERKTIKALKALKAREKRTNAILRKGKLKAK